MATLEPPVTGPLAADTSRGIGSIPRRRLVVDRWSRALIASGGQGLIALILAIFVFLVIEAWPLARGARIDPAHDSSVPGSSAAVLVDPHLSHAASVSPDGMLRVVSLAGDETVLETSLLPEGATAHRVFEARPDAPLLLSTSDGRLVATELAFDVTFADNARVVTPRLRAPLVVTLDESGAPVPVAAVQASGSATTFVGQLASGELALVRIAVEENAFTGERSESVQRTTLAGGLAATQLIVDPSQRSLYAGTAAGELAWWDLEGSPEPVEVLRDGRSPVTALAILKGGRTLVVGREDGTIENWFRIRRGLDENLTRARSLGPLASAVAHLTASGRDRSFLAVGAGGDAALFYATSGRLLWSGTSPVGPAGAVSLSPKGDSAVFGGEGEVAVLTVDAPHPEVSWRTYFGRLWYEGAEKAEAVWQSTGGSDDFESKFGLLPLLFGTLKGTLYSLFLAVPIAILGAMYTSQFMHPRFQRVIKPTVEMMAALPSVVLGLVAGLWLAPRLELHFPALVGVLLLTPPILVASGALWAAAPAALRARFPVGAEVLWFALVLLLCWTGIFQAGPWFETVLFGGDYQSWLFETLGLRYDQRNAAVVGIAMGFAVIPIIFSITEDAFSSVPPTLAAGSLALGANRWETVTQVVLPTASPAIFSAVMVGLGRAVGETMIVLMATGNTPIMDWSVFNGFRSLSANIAVEIPEAPHGGTLYRTLFLTALLLFAFTFVINTVAELVRVRLRRRFGRL
jgi:phosphate transport system permease protein